MDIGTILFTALMVGLAVYGGLRLAVYQIEQERKKQNDHKD